MYKYEKPYVEVIVLVPNNMIMDQSLGWEDDEESGDDF